MATTAKKPTPKTQKTEPAKTTAKNPATRLAAVSDESSSATQGAAQPTPTKIASAKANTGEMATSAEPVKPAPAEPSTGCTLTDEDILRMPPEDYMNEVQLQFFKAKLLAMRAEILNNARKTSEHLKENEAFADPNDRATVEEENMLEQRVRDRERKLLKKIEQSLARIERGEYGYCLETGEPIGIPRLLARPTAELSIEAQERHERMKRLYAD